MKSGRRTERKTPPPRTEAVTSSGHSGHDAWRAAEDFATLIENIPDAIFKSRGGVIVWCNDAVQDMFGYTKDEFLGTDVSMLLSADVDCSQLRETIYHLAERESYRGTARTLKKDGSEVFVEFSISRIAGKDPPQFVTVVSDITKRELAEQELRENRDRYRLLAENATDVIWTMDMNLQYTFISPSIERQRGYSPEEFMNIDRQDAFTHETLQAAVEALSEQTAIEGRKQSEPSRSWTVEMEAYCKDGSTIWTESRMAFLRSQDGNPVGILGVTRDITERKLTQEALRNVNIELERRVDERTAELEVINRELRTEVEERKRAEEALQQSEERFRTLIENSPDAITVLNADGTLRYESPSISHMLGYDPGVAMGKTSFELVHTDDLPEVAESMSKLLQNPGGSTQLDVRVRHKDGSWRTLEVVARNLLDDPAVEGIVVNQRDITERKQAEEQIRRSEERYRLLAENVSDIIWTMDMNLKYTYVSPSVERLRGYSVEEVMTQGIQASVAPESLELALNVFAEELAIEEMETKDINRMRTLELELNCKDGSTVWTEIKITPLRDTDGGPVGILGITRDITQRRQMEKALRESEESLRALIENAPDSITAYDLDGTILDCNRRGEELIGCSREKIVGKSMFEIGVIPEDSVARASRSLEKNAFSQIDRPFEFDLLRKDGSRITVEATTITVERGGRPQIICVSRDITERKQMEQQLLLAGRLAAVGELAAGVAHELNNPLTAVQGFAQFLAQRSNLDDDTREDLETIYSEAQRATKITGNLLSFARKYKPEKRLISINEALEKSLELHAYRMKVCNVEVVKQLDPDLPETMADFHQMQQVFVNIITNAEQAMTDLHGKGKLVVQTEKAGGMIRIIISDDGPGIPDDILKSVFDPFFTTKEVGRGTGLGLSICYGIVREHGGRLYAESARGKGATFIVEIPIVSEERSNAGVVNSPYLFHSIPEQP